MESKERRASIHKIIFFFFVEDKCARCDVHAHCENGKCVCDGGFYGGGTRGDCFRIGGELLVRFYMTSGLPYWCPQTIKVNTHLHTPK